MTPVQVLVVIAGVLCTAGILILAGYLLRRYFEKDEISSVSQVLDLQREMSQLKVDLYQQFNSMNEQMHHYFQNNSRFLIESQEGFHKTVGAVQDRLGQLQLATHQMIDIGKDISSLQNILKAPKLRGGIGELLLTELLSQVLPRDYFATQYSFKNGTIVDAVIFLGDGLIPVDAKFPLENFKRIIDAKDEETEGRAKKAFVKDIHNHIESIAAKYILPEEGTFEFALMYIPAENVYYETIIKDESLPNSISDYAIKKKVMPVSPNSFYAYLQAIVRGLKGLRIEQSAQRILEGLAQLQSEFEKCQVEFEKTEAHLSSANTSFAKAVKRFEGLHGKLISLDDIRRIHQQQTVIESSNEGVPQSSQELSRP